MFFSPNNKGVDRIEKVTSALDPCCQMMTLNRNVSQLVPPPPGPSFAQDASPERVTVGNAPKTPKQALFYESL